MLQNFVAMELPGLGINNPLFQQDGVTAYTTRQTMNILREMFPGRIISRFGDIAWPARSPDLTAPDFFLWGYLKGKVYRHHPRTLQNPKTQFEMKLEILDLIYYEK